MLTKFRIEVEEETAEACVEALWKYEYEIQRAEAKRYHDLWPVEGGVRENPDGSHESWVEDNYPKDHPWSDGVVPRSYFNDELGRDLIEEVIEYDESIPGYRGRRVVRFDRVDTRSRKFAPIRPPHEGEYVDPQPAVVTSD